MLDDNMPGHKFVLKSFMVCFVTTLSLQVLLMCLGHSVLLLL